MFEIRSQTLANINDSWRFDFAGTGFVLLAVNMGDESSPAPLGDRPRVILRRANLPVADFRASSGMVVTDENGFQDVELIAPLGNLTYYVGLIGAGQHVVIPRPADLLGQVNDNFATAVCSNVVFAAGQTKDLVSSMMPSASEIIITPASALKVSGQNSTPSADGYVIAGGTSFRMTGNGAKLRWKAYSAAAQTVHVMRISGTFPSDA